MLRPLPDQNSYQPLILGDLPSATPLVLPVRAFLESLLKYTLLLIDPLAKLSNRLKEEFDLC